VTRLDELIALFNRRSLDLPDGLFTRQTQFVLNGVPFEARMGRSPADPLVLMLTRGPAGYRFVVKAVQHAVPDGSLQRGAFETQDADGESIVTGQVWLSGHVRGTSEPAEILIDVQLRVRQAAIVSAAVSIADDDLQRLREARLRP
jgi:hypothetical protein